MRLYFENHKGVRIDLDQWPYWVQTGDFQDWEWDVSERSGRIGGFAKGIAEKSIVLSVAADTHEQFMEHEYPLFAKIPPGSSTVSWSGDYGWEITLYIERSEPRWIL